MPESPITQPSLLMRLRGGSDNDSWSVFVELYAPLIHRFCRERGVQDADASDLTQDVLMSVVKAIDSFEYDPERCSFRHWLFTLVENRLRNFWRKRNTACRGSGGTAASEFLSTQPQSNGHSAKWDEAYERHLFQVAADQVRNDFKELTWLAFCQTAIEGRSGKEVAAELGMSVAAVYMSKRRVVTRIREQIKVLGDLDERRNKVSENL